MSRAVEDVTEASSHTFGSTVKGWFGRAGARLSRYHPQFGDRRFWVVQVLVIGIAALHDTIEFVGIFPHLGRLYFIPVSLFFVPLAYAAVTFGFAGSLATALLVTIIAMPNWIFWHGGLERLGELFQLAIVVVVALFVGQRVDLEMSARRRAEAASAALRSSEMKYQPLFESSPIAILVLDSRGAILDANPAAGALFGKALETLKSMTVADLIGVADGRRLLASAQKDKWQKASLTINFMAGSEVYLEPMSTRVSDSQGNVIIQVLFRDITQERHREAGLKAYAAHVLRAQEEERQRVARELHDDTIQTMVLLCRRLDNVEKTSVPLPASAVEELREARKIAEEVVKGLRDFSRALRPPILDDLGVVASVRKLLSDFAERTGIETQLKVVGTELRLPRDIELGMFRIAQEALWNAQRYSKATEVVLAVTFADGKVGLEINDNGVGFNVPPVLGALSANGQLGLLGMQERAELVGGRLEVRSSLGKGTSIAGSFPIPRHA